jgi:hypothetical protein
MNCCDGPCHQGLDCPVRKVKAYPAVPADIDPVPETWHRIGAFMLWSIFTVLAVICLGLFFTGVWIWSLLI